MAKTFKSHFIYSAIQKKCKQMIFCVLRMVTRLSWFRFLSFLHRCAAEIAKKMLDKRNDKTKWEKKVPPTLVRSLSSQKKTTSKLHLTQKKCNQIPERFRFRRQLSLAVHNNHIMSEWLSISIILFANCSVEMETFHKVFRLILAVFWCLNQCSARNVELTNEVWHRFDKSIDWEVQNAVQTLNETVEKFSLFQNYSDNYESRDAAEYSRVGVFLFTRYCGPGARLLNRFFKTDERTYADIDFCCKMHDDCPDYVLQPADYNSYPGLDVRPQFFSRLARYNWIKFQSYLRELFLFAVWSAVATLTFIVAFKISIRSMRIPLALATAFSNDTALNLSIQFWAAPNIIRKNTRIEWWRRRNNIEL